MEKYLHQELTHKIIGMIYQIYNQLGFGYQEKYYQRAFAELLNNSKLSYRRELYNPIKFNGRIIGKYFMDFLVDNKVVVEFKVSNEVFHKHFMQVIGYLKAHNLEIGLIALIHSKGVKIKRVINSQSPSA